MFAVEESEKATNVKLIPLDPGPLASQGFRDSSFSNIQDRKFFKYDRKKTDKCVTMICNPSK